MDNQSRQLWVWLHCVWAGIKADWQVPLSTSGRGGCVCQHRQQTNEDESGPIMSLVLSVHSSVSGTSHVSSQTEWSSVLWRPSETSNMNIKEVWSCASVSPCVSLSCLFMSTMLKWPTDAFVVCLQTSAVTSSWGSQEEEEEDNVTELWPKTGSSAPVNGIYLLEKLFTQRA